LANGRRRERLARLEAEFDREARTVFGFYGDATREGLVSEIFALADKRWGSLPDIFVLCAGRGLPGTLLGSDSRKWRELIEINYIAALHQLRECASSFVRQAEREGCRLVKDIVVIGSTIGRQVSPFNPVYGSTKFAIHSVVEALRQEVCSRNIRATLIEPGFVMSEFQAVAGYDPQWFKSIEADMGPLLGPEDVARAVDFVIDQPMHVHLDDIRIRPTRQKV
jgi:NADP-dependent 3-hydroxy acid dehydrogenase YdfG